MLGFKQEVSSESWDILYNVKNETKTYSGVQLTELQKLRLTNKPKEGRDCLLTHWLTFTEKNHNEENDPNSFCDVYWDSIYCWPPAKAGETISRSCAEVMKNIQGTDSQNMKTISGNAFRVCAENGSWLWGNWTNYTECLKDLDDESTPGQAKTSIVVDAVRYILFIGSILSFLCLAVSLLIFFYFKCLRCDRITVHIHLMVALAFRFILLIFITEPFIFQRKDNYRTVDWACKTVLSLLMYATVASINWMFIQGHYLHGRLTTNVFDRGTPFKVYYTIGWGLPLILISSWTFLMQTYHHIPCWKGFLELRFIWIIVGPMILALSVNLLFLINIMRILLTKVHRTTTSNDTAQFRRAVKATAVLFPLLGVNNLLFVYNPGGNLENAYMLTNTILLSSQGIFVSFLYCFVSSDVRDAIRREYRRFLARRSANSIRSRTRKKSSFNTSVLMMTPRIGLTPTTPTQSLTHFKTRWKTSNTGNRSQSPSPETATNFLPQEEYIFQEQSNGSMHVHTSPLGNRNVSTWTAPGTSSIKLESSLCPSSIVVPLEQIL